VAEVDDDVHPGLRKVTTNLGRGREWLVDVAVRSTDTECGVKLMTSLTEQSMNFDFVSVALPDAAVEVHDWNNIQDRA
jgi:hypothetical protein